MSVQLPGLPASDETSLARNQYDGFYSVRARDFWGQNQLESRKVEEFQPHKHFYVTSGTDIKCRDCNIGFHAGSLGTHEGKLVLNGKVLEP